MNADIKKKFDNAYGMLCYYFCWEARLNGYEQSERDRSKPYVEVDAKAYDKMHKLFGEVKLVLDEQPPDTLLGEVREAAREVEARKAAQPALAKSTKKEIDSL
ncbi:hypothetical protein FACS1894188_13540 [Clostridia bacterium]|nr:hypothetical protein FACS1894188_13540 [Clostridia bacterium]